jgi:iron(III) transport system permease protein
VRHGNRLWLAGLVLAVSYLVVLPIGQIVVLGAKDNFSGYREAFGDPKIWNTVLATAGLGLGSLVIALVFGTALAWASSRLPHRLRLLGVLPLLPIVLPGIANVIGWTFLLSPRPGYLNALLRQLPWWDELVEGPIDVYTLPWIVIITGFSLTSFVYLFVNSGFQGIGSDIIETAQVAGASSLRIFRTVTLPLLRPTLIYGGAVALLLGLGQFTVPLLLNRGAGSTVLTTEMYQATSSLPTRYELAAALGAPLLVFGLGLIVLQRVLLGNQARFVTHSGKGFRPASGGSRVGTAMLLIYSCVATLLPVAGLVIVALSPFWGAKIDISNFSLESFRAALNSQQVTDAIYNSVSFSLIAMAIVIPLGFICAVLILYADRDRVLVRWLETIVALPLSVPSVVFGVGFLYTYTNGPIVLYGTRWVIVLVYVTLMLPFSTRMQMAGMSSFGRGYVESARVAGANAVMAYLRVLLPLLSRTIAGAAALVFVLLTHEFTASLLVRSSTTQVMGTVLFDYWNNISGYPLVAAFALIMAAVTAAGVVAALMLSRNASLLEDM